MMEKENKKLRMLTGRWARDSIIWVLGLVWISDNISNKFLMHIMMGGLFCIYLLDLNRECIPYIYKWIFKRIDWIINKIKDYSV